MKILCNKATKKIEAFSRWGDIEFDIFTQVVIDVSGVPDMKLDRLNNTEDGIRPATQAELDADLEEEKNTAAELAVSSPALESAIEEFASIITAGTKPSAEVIRANIKERIKGKT